MAHIHPTGVGKVWAYVKPRGKSKTEPLVADYLLFNFDSNGSTLKPKHRTALKGIAGLIQSKDPFANRKLLNINVNVIVVGSADRTGDAEENVALAKRRAMTAAAYIRKHYPLTFPLSCRRRGKLLSCTIMKNINYSVSDPKVDFNTLKTENLTDLKKWMKRPKFTPKGGNERDRAVFVRVIIDIKPVVPNSADLDYLFRVAKPFCEIEEIFFQLAPTLMGYTYSASPGVPFPKNKEKMIPEIRRHVKACTVARVFYLCRMVKEPVLNRMTVDEVMQEYDKRFSAKRRAAAVR